MLMWHFWLSTIFGIFLSGGEFIFDTSIEFSYISWPIRIQLLYVKLRQASWDSEMEGVDGT